MKIYSEKEYPRFKEGMKELFGNFSSIGAAMEAGGFRIEMLESESRIPAKKALANNFVRDLEDLERSSNNFNIVEISSEGNLFRYTTRSGFCFGWRVEYRGEEEFYRSPVFVFFIESESREGSLVGKLNELGFDVFEV